MLLYYPLEHLYYLRSKDILPTTLNISLPFLRAFTVRLDTLKLALWSTRAWLLYILLQLAHLREDAKLLKLRSRSVTKVKGDEAQAEKADLARRWDTWWSELFSNLGNLPLSIHWYVRLPPCPLVDYNLSMACDWFHVPPSPLNLSQPVCS